MTRTSQTTSLERLRQRIDEKRRDYRSGGPIVIVAFGDSVTMGATAQDVIEPSLVYHQRVKEKLESAYPGVVFSVINSGIGGDTTAEGLARLDRDVLRYQPDLVLIGFGLNDASEAVDRLATFTGNLRQIVRRIRAETQSDIILLTPNFMATRHSAAVQPSQHAMMTTLIERQNSGVLKQFADAIRDIGTAESLPVADVYAAWERLVEQGVDTTAMLANGLNHPAGDGHAIAADQVMSVIEENVRG